MTKAELMQVLEEIANAEFDGHFTVMKFTTNWRVCFGTPMEAYSEDPGDEGKEMCAGRTFEEAAVAAIRERRGAVCINWFDLAAAKREWAEEEVRIDAMTDEQAAAEEADFKRLCDEYDAARANGYVPSQRDDPWIRKTIQLGLGKRGAQ